MSLFIELKRRNVFRVGIAYVVVAWLVLQVTDVMIDNIGAPDWVFSTILMVLGIGFPVALVFAWAFEMTPEGLKREHEVDRSHSITATTGRKLDFIIIGVLVVALGYFIYESRFSGEADTAAEFTQTPSPATVSSSRTEEPADGSSSRTDEPADGSSSRTGEPADGSSSRTAQGADPGPNSKPAENSIAVLPFANRSRNEDDEFFVEGMHDDLLTQLAKINDLKVVSRTTAMKYKDTELSIPEIAAELGVSTILEGGVQRAGDRVRINAQLIDVAVDEHLWAETYDREMTVENLFDIQSDITREIVTAVRGELSEEESAALSQAPTDSVKAYEAYLMARSVMAAEEYTLKRYEKALPWTRKSLELDPEFSWAWAQLALNLSQQVWLGAEDGEDKVAEIQNAIDQANRYGLGQPEVLLAQGEYYYRIDRDYRAAISAFEKVVQMRPGDSESWTHLGLAQRRSDQMEQAVQSFRKSMEADPEDNQTQHSLVETLVYLKRFDEAEKLTRRFIEISPDYNDLKAALADVLMQGRGDLAGARNILAQGDLTGPSQSYGRYLIVLSYQRAWSELIGFLDNPEFYAPEDPESPPWWWRF
jgi:TolB-like protein/Tfp pilus assembly protein PilF